MASVLASRENLPESTKLQLKKLIKDGKTCASEGELHKSLKNFRKAYQLCPTEKIMSRIKRIEEVIAEDEEGSDDDYGFIELDNGLVIYKKLVERLYPHQINGIKWMYNLFKKGKKGGILADDMGLGKTIQVIAFISAMFDMKKAKNVLLVIPLSVIPNWIAEFENWAPGIRIECFHGASNKRKAVLQQCMRKRSVCITTYGLILTQWQALGETLHGTEFVWDYIILDEGHRIKNPSKTTKRLHSIPARNRVILTGTPVQNKVRDLWALMDWVTQGTVLGTQKTFKSNYEQPIERARQRDACAAEIQLGNSMAESLRKLTEPYILRRTKASLSSTDKENSSLDKNLQKKLVDGAQDDTTVSKQPVFPKLSTKNDFVVWVYLSEVQQNIYKDFLELDSVKELLTSHRSPLVHLTILKKICDHPRLLSSKACMELGLQSNDSISHDLNSSAIEDCAANRIDNITDQTLIEESGKLQFLIQLLIRLREEGHRTLIFSMSRKMLNIIQRILMNHKFKIMRLDGRVTKMAERQIRVKKFQEDPSYHVFLLTTQVGGVGLTLTAADRVVIYDPAWNPATDDQAIDRIYRIGQKKSVAVYRLITCGSVEEKIYRRQVFKNSVIQQSIQGSKDPYRYFTSQELKELFILDDVHSSNTQIQLQALHGHQRNIDDKMQSHIDFLQTLAMFGISDHDLMFSCKPDDFDYENEMSGEMYDNKVQAAQQQLTMESDQLKGQSEPELRWGAFNEEKRDSPPKNDENEPVYPIEGLSEQLEALEFKPKIDDELPTINRETKNRDYNKWDVKSETMEEKISLTTLAQTKSLIKETLAVESDDDDVIIVNDSPVSKPYTTFKKVPQVSSGSNNHNQHGLAPDSPACRYGNATNTSSLPVQNLQPSTPNVIEESFDIFNDVNSLSGDEPEANEEEWEKIFSPSHSKRKFESAHASFQQSPLVAGSNRRRQRITSDGDEDSDSQLPSSLGTTLAGVSNSPGVSGTNDKTGHNNEVHVTMTNNQVVSDDLSTADDIIADETDDFHNTETVSVASSSKISDDVSVCEDIDFNDVVSDDSYESGDVSVHDDHGFNDAISEESCDADDVSNYSHDPHAVDPYDDVTHDLTHNTSDEDVAARDVTGEDQSTHDAIAGDLNAHSVKDKRRFRVNVTTDVEELLANKSGEDSDATEEYYQDNSISDDDINFNLSQASEDDF
uniref:DNA excision repair protein ERCC-6-like n=1 Tax=Phallusia mammillata TaxID=59560 RepID=A0A6F9DBK1_9ASCI|nr:DNA excision repair protein ERCC-6-like [Phallusia mammillata]